MKIDGFDWDEGNKAKCVKYGVELVEIESLFENRPTIFPDKHHSLAEERWQAIGRTHEGRAIFVAFTLRYLEKMVLLRPVSARYMHAREVKYYAGLKET